MYAKVLAREGVGAAMVAAEAAAERVQEETQRRGAARAPTRAAWAVDVARQDAFETGIRGSIELDATYGPDGDSLT